MNQNWKQGNVPDIGLDEKNRHGLIELLNRLLADEFVIYARTLNYHWNVVGPHFGDLHALFNKLYEGQLDIADTLAERVRALGGKSIGTLKEFLASSTIDEAADIRGPNEMVSSLLVGYEALVKQIRKDIEDTDKKFGDSGTSNMLQDIIVKHEKSAWMLRAIIDEKFPCCSCKS